MTDSQNAEYKVISEFKRVSEIVSGDVLIGEMGGRSLVNDVEPSGSLPGLMRVETEHGHLYMDPEHEVEVER